MSQLDEIEAERLVIEQAVSALRAHTDIAQEWLMSGNADGLSVEIMDALEAVVDGCDNGLSTLQYRLKKLEIEISNMKFRSA